MSMPSSPELAESTRWHLDRKLREVPVSPEVLFSIVKHGSPEGVTVLEGLPVDTVLIEPDFDPFSGYFVLTVASSEFSPVPKGERIPQVMVTFRRSE